MVDWLSFKLEANWHKKLFFSNIFTRTSKITNFASSSWALLSDNYQWLAQKRCTDKNNHKNPNFSFQDPIAMRKAVNLRCIFKINESICMLIHISFPGFNSNPKIYEMQWINYIVHLELQCERIFHSVTTTASSEAAAIAKNEHGNGKWEAKWIECVH